MSAHTFWRLEILEQIYIETNIVALGSSLVEIVANFEEHDEEFFQLVIIFHSDDSLAQLLKTFVQAQEAIGKVEFDIKAVQVTLDARYTKNLQQILFFFSQLFRLRTIILKQFLLLGFRHD